MISIGKTRRGIVIYEPKIKLEKFEATLKNVPKKSIEEFNFLIAGNKKALLKMDWWNDDEELLKEYINLYKQLKAIKTKIDDSKCFSRNLVAVNAKCCYSWIQKLDDRLIVISRSTDMIKGYKWDKWTFKLIASYLKCLKIEVVWLHQHYYLSNMLGSSRVARRMKNGKRY